MTENLSVISPQSKSLQLTSVHQMFKTDSCENLVPVIVSVFLSPYGKPISGLNFSLCISSLEIIPTFQDLPIVLKHCLVSCSFCLCPRCAKDTSS